MSKSEGRVDKLYRLPTRVGAEIAWTDNAERYARAWKSLSDAVEEFFPSYEVQGWDPFIHLVHKNAQKYPYYTLYFDMTMDAAIDLTEWEEAEANAT